MGGRIKMTKDKLEEITLDEANKLAHEGRIQYLGVRNIRECTPWFYPINRRHARFYFLSGSRTGNYRPKAREDLAKTTKDVLRKRGIHDWPDEDSYWSEYEKIYDEREAEDIHHMGGTVTFEEACSTYAIDGATHYHIGEEVIIQETPHDRDYCGSDIPDKIMEWPITYFRTGDYTKAKNDISMEISYHI